MSLGARGDKLPKVADCADVCCSCSSSKFGASCNSGGSEVKARRQPEGVLEKPVGENGEARRRPEGFLELPVGEDGEARRQPEGKMLESS